jgi:hypothetical protein
MLSVYLVMAVSVQTIANDRELHFSFLAHVPPPGFEKVGRIRIHNHYAFCTLYAPDSDGAGFIAIDVEDPANPTTGGYLPLEDRSTDVALAGNFAFLVHAGNSSGDQPFSLVDISNPHNLTLKAIHNNNQTGGSGRIEISGQQAFMFDDDWKTLEIWNIADPMAPTRIALYDTSTWRHGLPTSPDFSFVADSDESWIIHDTSDPSNPRVLGGYKSIASVLGVAVSGDYAYAIRESLSPRVTLDILDISLPGEPKLLSSYDAPDEDIYGKYVTHSDGYVYVSSGSSSWGTWQAVDVSDPANPLRAGVSLFGGYPYFGPEKAVVQRDLAYVANGIAGLALLKISRANPQRVGSYDTGGSGKDVAVQDNYAYIADGDAGLQLVDISQPTNAIWLGGFDTEGNAVGVAVSGNHAFVADTEAGLQVIDIRDPSRLSRVGHFDTGGEANDVVVVDRHAFVAVGRLGLQVLDITDPTRPTRAGGYDTTGIAHRLVVSGNFAFIAEASSLQVIDISDPSNPVRVGGSDTVLEAYDVAVVDNLAYVATTDVGLQVFDISNPADPVLVSAHRGIKAKGVAVAGDYAYVADHSSGLRVIDISNPVNPQSVGGNSSFSASRVSIHGDKVYVAGGADGLIILNKYTDLRIGPAIVLDDGRLRLRLSGASGQRVRVQRSLNLKDWADWKTVTLGDTGCELTDSITASQCFYRAIEDNSAVADEP